jgi:hypothetical protein
MNLSNGQYSDIEYLYILSPWHFRRGRAAGGFCHAAKVVLTTQSTADLCNRLRLDWR